MRYILGILTLAATLCAADPSTGTWKMNAAKTKYTVGAAPKEQTVTITESGADLSVKIIGVASTGAKITFSYTMPAAGGKGKVVDGSSYDGVSAKMISPTERELTYLKGGKSAYTAHVTIAPGAKTMTVHGKGMNAAGQEIEGTTIYDKQ